MRKIEIFSSTYDDVRFSLVIAQSKAEQQDRMRQIVRRRRLVDLAKAQAQEVAYLRAEVERLRMKTFPALVQIEH